MEDDGMARGRTNDGVVEWRMVDSMAVSISPSTPVASLFLLFESYCFFQTRKGCSDEVCVFFVLKKNQSTGWLGPIHPISGFWLIWMVWGRIFGMAVFLLYPDRTPSQFPVQPAGPVRFSELWQWVRWVIFLVESYDSCYDSTFYSFVKLFWSYVTSRS